MCENLQIALAAEWLKEVHAAEVLRVPLLGHTEPIHATEGDIIEVNRESLFAGGGTRFRSSRSYPTREAFDEDRQDSGVTWLVVRAFGSAHSSLLPQMA